MNLIQQLSYIDIKISSLKSFQKVELYLIPLILSIFIIYNLDIFDNTTQKREEIRVLQSNSVDFHIFLKDLQNFTDEKNIDIVKTQQNQRDLRFEFEGGFIDVLKLFYFIETYSSVNNIKTLRVDKRDQNIAGLILEFEFAHYKYDFKSLDLSSLELQYEKKSINEENEAITKRYSNVKFELKAVVNNETLINGVWLKQGEFIEDFKVVKIDLNSVILQRDDEIKTLNLWEREKDE